MIAAGRPLRALGVLGLGAGLWLVVRAPEMAAQYDKMLTAMMADRGLSSSSVHDTRSSRASLDFGRDERKLANVKSVERLRRPGSASGMMGPQAPDLVRPESSRAIAAVVAPEIQWGPGPEASAAGGTVAPSNPGFDLATRAYAALQVGDRRDASALFTAALAAAPDAAQAGAWAAERGRLNRRWSGDAYVLFRDAGTANNSGGAAAAPVLGGSQSGASIAWAADPLARRPLAVIGRIYAAHDHRGLVDGNTAQAAIGVRWQPVRGVSIAAERLIALGAATTGDWNLRAAAGGERRVGPALVDGYAEAGVRGNGDMYAGGQARAGVPVGMLGPVAVSAGPGAWGSVQTGFATVTRLDVGAGVAAQLPKGLVARADWRWRVAGSAEPGSGPAVTVAWAF